MNNLINPMFFARDANGIRTEYNIGVKLPSSSTFNIELLAGAKTGTSHTVGTTVYLIPGTAPATGEGKIYYDSTAHKLKVYTGAGWETITSV